MKKIERTLSLEQFISRLPSVIPSYKDNNSKLFYFDEESLKRRNYLYTSNYGMVPVNVSISGFTEGSYEDFDFCEFNEYNKNNKKFSFYSLSNIYYFFKEYYNLLKKYGHCDRVYSSATEYYLCESANPKYSNQMKYGFDEETYLELDREFASYGGKVSATTVEVSNIETIVEVEDIGFFKWMCERLIPTFIIPSEYKDYWHRDVLYYPDVIKWLGWFKERVNTYKNKDISDCNTTTNCCDCEEYFKRGGEEIAILMNDWYDKIESGITEMNSIITRDLTALVPTMIHQINLTTSLHDSGEMSILSEQYEEKKDYRTSNGYTNENNNSGTTIVKDNQSLILTSACTGYDFDENFMEPIFINEAWSSYTKTYKDDNIGSFRTRFNFYAFDKNNRKLVANAESGITRQCKNELPITWIDGVIIYGEIFEVQKEESGMTSNGKIYPVYRDRLTNTPYAVVNGKTYYPNLSLSSETPYYYFTIFKNNKYGKERDERTLMDFIQYNGGIYQVNDSGVTIDSTDYNRIDGYAQTNDNEIYYIIGDDVKYSDDFLEPPTPTTISNNSLIVDWNYIPTIYKTEEITGQTSSKLSQLKIFNSLVDDVGNKIEGLFDVNNYYHQPQEGETLDLIYQVGNTANIMPYVNTMTNPNDTSMYVNYFVGDIITKMVFYYKNLNGTVNEYTTTSVEQINDDNPNNSGKFKITYYLIIKRGGLVRIQLKEEIVSGYTSLSAIQYSTTNKEFFENEQQEFFEDDIYCDITYYNGATLKRQQYNRNLTDAYTTKFMLAYVGSGSSYSYGVKYTETVNFVKTNTEYYLKKKVNNPLPYFKNNPENHSVSYPIYVYNLKQKLVPITSNTYDTTYETPLANFITEINITKSDKPIGFDVEYYDTYDKYENDLNDNVEVYPTFMEEYKFGNSVMQNVDSDIYIDRGINAALEKHLKLGEVFTLEALEQYGNGFFQMMKN